MSVELDSTRHARVAVVQLHLNGFLFSCISIDKKQTELFFFYSPKHLNSTVTFFSDFVTVLMNW